MRAVYYITDISHSVASEMVAFSHTLGLLMSKLRSCLEAGKKQPRVWIEYVCSVAKMLLYPSFGAPLVFLGSPYDSSEMVLGRAKRQSRARSGFEEGSKVIIETKHC